jgi:hypothetical protein
MGGLNRYTVEWYNPLTGQFEGVTETRSGLLGALELEYPILTADDSRPLVLFKLYRTIDGSFLRPSDSSENILIHDFLQKTGIQKESKDTQIEGQGITEITLTPNPAKDEVLVVMPSQENDNYVRWEIYNAQGMLINKSAEHTSSFTLNISSLANGVYLFKLYTDDSVFNKKIIKQ